MAVLGAVLALAGCATGKDPEVQRATEGPTAEEVYMARFVGDYGRLPTFDETLAFRSALDDRVVGISLAPSGSQHVDAGQPVHLPPPRRRRHDARGGDPAARRAVGPNR